MQDQEQYLTVRRYIVRSSQLRGAQAEEVQNALHAVDALASALALNTVWELDVDVAPRAQASLATPPVR